MKATRGFRFPGRRLSHEHPARRFADWAGPSVLACAWIAMAAVSVRAQENPATSAPAAQQDAEPALTHRPAEQPLTSPTVALTVPKGTPIQVALDKEVRIEKVGQPVCGHVVEPVYAFDKLVIPAGTEVTGQIAQVEGVSTGKRVMSALDADFTPDRKIEVEFDQLTSPAESKFPFTRR